MADQAPNFIDPFANQQPGSGLTSDVMSGVHRAAAGLGMAGAALGLPTVGYAQTQAMEAEARSRSAEAAGIPQSWQTVEGPVDALKYIGGQAAQMAPTIAGMAAGGFAGSVAGGPVGGFAGAGAALYPAQFGENLQQQFETTGKTNPLTAAALAVPETAMQMVSPEGRLARGVLGAASRTGSRVANAALTAGREAVVNAGIGGTTGFLNQVNKAAVDENYDVLGTESLKQVGEGAATGALLGGIIGGARGVLHTPVARVPDDAGGVSSRSDAAQSPATDTSPAQVSANTEKVPAYQRAGANIPGITDQFNAPNDVGAAMTQGELPMSGAGPFTPRFDERGNPLPGTERVPTNAEAAAATQGPGAFRSEADAVNGLQALHRDLTAKMGEAVQAGDSNAVAALTEQIKGVETHLSTLNASPAAGQLDLFSGRAERTGARDGAVLFQDKDAQTQLNAAIDIAQNSQTPAQPNPNAQIALPQGPTQETRPTALPGQLPTQAQAANARMPAEPAAGRVEVPPGAPRQQFELNGNRTPQFENPTAEPRPPFELQPQDGRQGQLALPPLIEPTPGTPGQEARPHDTKTGDMFGGGQNAQTPWQTRMRLAWKDASDGNLQGFHRAMKEALSAKTPEEAAAAIRDKAANEKTSTPFSKLDMVHRALTGEGIEEGGIRAARESGGEGAEAGGAAQADQRTAAGEEVSRAAGEKGGAGEGEAAMESAGGEARVAAEGRQQVEGANGEAAPTRAETLQRLVQTLEHTKDPDEFQQAVNELYAESQRQPENGRDQVSSLADQYLYAPESGVSNENLKVARDTYTKELLNSVDRYVESNARKARSDRLQGMRDLFQRGKEAAGEKRAASSKSLEDLPSLPVNEEARRATAQSMAEMRGGTADEWYKRMYGDDSTRRSERSQNPDIGQRNMLPENMRMPGAEHTGATMLDHLITNSSSERIRGAMRLIAASGRDMADVPVHIVRDGDMVPSHVGREMHDGADAVTVAAKGRTPEVWVHNTAADENTIAHELLHAALPERMTPHNDGGMTGIMNEVRARMKAAGMLDTPEGRFFESVALHDPNEFTSYGFTSPTFMKMLNALDEAGKPSLWDRFKAAVAAIFKGPRAFFDALLDRNQSGAHNPIAVRMEEALGNMLNPDDPRMAAERENTYRQMSVTASGADSALKEATHDVWDGLRGLVRAGKKVAMSSMPTHAISDAFSYRLPALKDVTRAMDDRTQAQHVLARRAADVHDALKQAYKGAGKSLDRLNTLIEDTQIAGVDPRDPRQLDRVQANLLRAKDQMDQVSRKAGATDLEKAQARSAMRRASAAARIDSEWRNMSDAERTAVGKAFDALKHSINERQRVLNDILLRSRDGFHDEALDQMREEGASQQQIDDQILRTYGNVLRLGQDPYAPLRRYGDWVTVASSKEYRAAEAALRDARVKQAEDLASGSADPANEQKVREAKQLLDLLTADPEHRIVQFHDTSVASSNRAAELKAQHPGMEVQRFARDDYMQHAGTLSGGMIGKIIDAVGEQLPPELRDNIGAVIREMYVDSLPDNSFDTSMAGRAGVAGYSTDFSRSILDTLLRDSFNISTLEHGDQLGAALRDLDEQRRASDDDSANAIYKSIAKRLSFSTDHANFRQLEQRVSEVTHFFYLGFSPGFLLMNSMQMPMITMPMLYARFGLHANGAITRAVGDIWKAIKAGNLDLEKNGMHMSPQERDMLNQLQNLGILNMTQLHDMTTAARASNIIDPQTAGEGVRKGWEISKDIANLPAQYVETVNRAASALAAYRLAVEGKSKFGAMEHGAAMDYAAKIVRDSHVDYSAQNNAAWLRAPGGRFLFQFKKYWLNMLSMVGLNMWDSFGHGREIKQLRNDLASTEFSPEELSHKQAMLNELMERRAVARRTLAGLYGVHFLHTGAMGMPFAGAGIALSNVMRNWYNDPEDHADTSVDLQNWLASVFGVDPADTIMHGIWSGVFGAGISKRIGMGELAFPMMGSTRANQSMTGTYDKVLLGALGPSVGLGEQMVQGMDQLAKGNYERGVEKMLPKFAGDVLKATRYAGDQGATTPTGKVVTPLNNWDAIKEALGVTPTKVLNAYDAQQATAEAKTALTETRKGLVENYAKALKAGEDTTDAKAAVDAFNQRNKQPLQITMSEVMKARNAIGKAPKPPTGRAKEVAAETDRSAFTKEE